MAEQCEHGEDAAVVVLGLDESDMHATLDAHRLAVAVPDDGVGGADDQGAGLRGLADRVEALDGRLTLDSPPGGGTRLRAEIPTA